MEDASIEPSRFLWDRIEKQLPANTKWYSKYKYLLLLLMLSLSSSTSIVIYKNFFLKKNVSKVAINKRLVKDEIAQRNIPALKTINSTAAVINKTSSNSNTVNFQNQASVASFYTPQNNTADNVSASIPRRQERLTRYEVNTTVVEKLNKKEQVNILNASSPGLQQTKGTLKDKPIAGNFSEASEDVVSKVNDALKNNSLSPADENINTEEITSIDITEPIAQPIKNKETELLTVSLTPVKGQVSPLPSRQVLESLLKPEKLEKLKLESKSGSISNLDPKKAKMLKIKKQFNGYDINKGFHIGGFFNLNNNWLTNKYYTADENTTSIKPQMRIGKAYGINIGYDYTDRWGIELELQLSEQGQKYLVEQLDGSHSKSVNLMYTKFPLMVKYKHTFINNFNTRPMSVSFLFGPQMSILVKQKILMDGEIVKNAPGYNKTELGLTGGFDYDLFLTRFMCLTVGARAGFGSTLKKGQPMSIQLGMTTQFNFRFPKKLK